MVRLRLPLAAVVLAGLVPTTGAAASKFVFTGDVERDFPLNGADFRGIAVDFPTPGPPGIRPVSNPDDIEIPAWMKAEGKHTGWNFQDIRLAYDRETDTLAVGVNFFGVAGDVDGDGDPNTSDPRTIASGGIDEARFSGGETVAIAFDLNNDQAYDIIAGIPLNKPPGQDGIASFTLAKYDAKQVFLPIAFGETQIGSVNLLDHLGQKSIETSLASPDIEFEITNFSTIGKLFKANFDPVESAISVGTKAGGLHDTIVGEDQMRLTAVLPQTIVPEPSAVLGWSLLAVGAAAWRLRRRGRAGC